MITDQWWEKRRWGRTAIVILCALFVVMEAYLVTRRIRVVGLPGTPLKADSFLVDDLANGRRVSQTLKTEVAGFNEILLRMSPLDGIYSGNVVLALYENGIIEGKERLLYREVVPVRVAVSEPAFVFRIPVVDEPAGRWFRLDIWMAEADSSSGVGLWATPGRWSGGGSMFVNDEGSFAELVFETRAATRTTVWTTLGKRLGGGGLILFVVLAACGHAAFFMILYSLIVTPRLPTRQSAL